MEEQIGIWFAEQTTTSRRSASVCEDKMWRVCLRGAMDLASDVSCVAPLVVLENGWNVMVSITVGGCASIVIGAGCGRLECI